MTQHFINDDPDLYEVYLSDDARIVEIRRYRGMESRRPDIVEFDELRDSVKDKILNEITQ